jgi:RHH-type transcriptional regulator, rel operon repressor / antitoxin RelB
MVSVKLPEDIDKCLEKLAQKTGNSKSYHIRQAILEYLEYMEDYYLAEERMKSFSDAKTISLKDLKDRYNIED